MVNQLVVQAQSKLPVTVKEVAEETKLDRCLQKVLDYIRSQWPQDCPSEELEQYFMIRAEMAGISFEESSGTKKASTVAA